MAINYTEALGDALNPNMREGILNWLNTDEGNNMWKEMYNEVDGFRNKWESGYLTNEDWFLLTWGLIKRYPEWCPTQSEVESVNLSIVEFMGFPPMGRLQREVLKGFKWGNLLYQRQAKSLGGLYEITLNIDSKRWECLSKSLTETYNQIKNPTLKAIFPYLGLSFMQYIIMQYINLQSIEDYKPISEEPNPELKDAKLKLLKSLKENFNKNVCDVYITYFSSHGYLPLGLFINPKVLIKPFMNWDQIPF